MIRYAFFSTLFLLIISSALQFSVICQMPGPFQGAPGAGFSGGQSSVDDQDTDDAAFSGDSLSRDTGVEAEEEEPGYGEPDSGNWYEKLRWWKEAKQLIAVDIHDIMEHVSIIEAEFDQKKTNLFKQLDSYNSSLPIARTAAIPLITSLMDELKKAQEQVAEPKTKEERMEIEKATDQLKQLEALKGDFEQFNLLVSRLDEASNVIFKKQIQLCEQYEGKAVANFERIEKIYDDEKAHDYYDIIENSLENIRALVNYLVGPFPVFIDETWTKMQQIMPRVKSAIADLDKQGVQVRILTEKEKAEQAALKKEKEELRKKAQLEKAAAEARKKMPWWKRMFYSIGDFFGSIWNGIKRGFSSIGGWFSSSKTPAGQKPTKAPAKPGIKPDVKAEPKPSAAVPALPANVVPKAVPAGPSAIKA